VTSLTEKLNQLHDDPFIMPVIRTYYVPWSDKVYQELVNIMTRNSICREIKKTIDVVSKKNEELKEQRQRSYENVQSVIDKASGYLEEKDIEKIEGNENKTMALRQALMEKRTPRGKIKELLDKINVEYPKGLTKEELPVIIVQEMPFADGGDLADRLLFDDSKFTIEELENMWIQLLWSLYIPQKYFHFVHNDIKPANILIQTTKEIEEFDLEGRVLTLPTGSPHFYLSDFGLSTSEVTSDWSYGTPDFMTPFSKLYFPYSSSGLFSPLRGPDFDLWSLGLVFWLTAAQGQSIDGRLVMTDTISRPFKSKGEYATSIDNLAKKIFSEFKGRAKTTRGSVVESDAVASAMIQCALMKALGHGFLPPSKVKLPSSGSGGVVYLKLDANIKSLGTLFSKYEETILKAIEDAVGVKNYFGKVCDAILKYIGPNYYAIIKSMLAWPSDNDTIPNGKIFFNVFQKINIPTEIKPYVIPQIYDANWETESSKGNNPVEKSLLGGPQDSHKSSRSFDFSDKSFGSVIYKASSTTAFESTPTKNIIGSIPKYFVLQL
jgi:serine/threonine protein kinase